MAMKRVAILALAASVFAQMDMGSSDSMTTDSAASTTDLMATSTDAASVTSAVATSSTTSGMDYSYSIPPYNASTKAMTITSSSATVTGMLSMTTTSSSSQMDMGGGTPMGTGSMIMPNATATTSPIPGRGVVNGVSTGLLLVSIVMTALLQL
ncbi:hypothetical protein F5Y16DRAFT_12636 [Xylariaceae sp. FL0255]|nr:hypothetical protein F5Y16DRAFT_12636 [Xylariaceae sp. FL0255]